MRKRKRSKQTMLSVHGKLVDAVTIAGLAEIIGKSVDTIKRYEATDVFPQAPVMAGNVRYYPLHFAKLLKILVDKIPGNKRPDADLIVQINILFKEEREKYYAS